MGDDVRVHERPSLPDLPPGLKGSFSFDSQRPYPTLAEVGVFFASWYFFIVLRFNSGFSFVLFFRELASAQRDVKHSGYLDMAVVSIELS